MANPVRIGVPRALFYYLIFPFWSCFWRELGCEVVLSSKTTKAILDEGVKEAVTDACVPIKVYHGHVKYLADKVDYLFIPRLVNLRGKYTFCPKFLGLPDLIHYSTEGLPPIISPRIDRKSRAWYQISERQTGLFKECLQAASIVTSDEKKVWDAYCSGKKAEKKFSILLADGFTPAEAIDALEQGKSLTPHVQEFHITLAVLGYPYAIYDPFVSVGLIEKLKDMGVRVVTPETFTENQLKHARLDLAKELFWHFSDRNVRSAMAAFENGQIDGIAHVTAFGCGPDFMVNKLIELEAKSRSVPFLSLSIDEQSGEAGMITRLEAFTDMIRRRSARHGQSKLSKKRVDVLSQVKKWK